MSNQFEALDCMAARLGRRENSAYYYLSTNERIYVAIAANRIDLLEEDGFTIAEALDQIGVEWANVLIERWKNRGNPKYYS